MYVGPRSLSTTARLMALATALGFGVGSFPTTALATAQPGDVPDAPAETSAPAVGDETTTRAAILPVIVEGDDMPEADRAQLAGRLVDGLERGDFEVIAPDDVVAASSAATSCRDASCYMSIAKAVGASHVVVAVVNAVDRDYKVEVVLVDGKNGSQVASSEDSCQICGVTEVGDLLDTAAATLRTKLDNLAQGPATLVVASTPDGAQVSIDGELKGTTPFNAPVLAGKHVLRISYEGYITVEREVDFVEGIEDVQRFELEKVPSRLPARPWGWVSLGLGIAGVGTAVTFSLLDDRQYEFGGKCPTKDAQGQCPRLWDTDWIVLGSAIGGAGLATLGVAILLSSAGRRGNKVKAETTDAGGETARLPMRKRLRWGVGPGSVSVQGRF